MAVIFSLSWILICCTFSSGWSQTTQASEDGDIWVSHVNQESSVSIMNQVISVDFKNTPLLDALKRITSDLDMKLSYSREVLTLDNRITADFENTTANKIIYFLLEDTGLRHAISEKGSLVLFEYMDEEKESSSSEQAIQTVSGSVTDAQTGETLPGVNIAIKGTRQGVSTDGVGQYELEAPTLQDTLIFSFVGYESQEEPINGRTNIDVALNPTTIAGEEVTVIAYGEQSTDEITGSISSVENEEIAESPVGDIGNALTGKLEGVQTLQGSGGPGSSTPEIFIRGIGSLSEGRSQPLYVLDGVIVRNANSITQLDPRNIESISVLKDASSLAVYGIEGANGAIVVKTKRGEEGSMQISVNSNLGFQVPTNIPEIADSYDTARMYNLAQIYDGVDPNNVRFSETALEAFRTNSNPLIYPDIDWQDYMLNKYAFQTETNITASGGTDDVRFLVAGGFLKQDGLFKTFASDYDFNPTFNRYNFRTNIDYDITSSTQVSLTGSGRIGQDREQLASWEEIYRGAPYAGAGIIDGKVIQSGSRYIPGRKQGILNRYYGQGYNEFDRTSLNLQLVGTQQLDFLAQGLNLQIKGGYNIYFTENRYRRADIAVYEPYYQTDVNSAQEAGGDSTVVYRKIGQDTELDYSEDYGKDRDWYIEGRLNYKHDFGPHGVKGLLLYSQRQTYYPPAFSGIPRRVVSTVGRFNYNYDQRYLLEFSVGYNGSENFAAGKRFGFFPAVSGGWILTNEPYFPDISQLNFLKFRASYGITGNDSGIGRFLYLPGEYNENAPGYSFGYDNPNESTGSNEGSLGNPGVTWEEAEKWGVGMNARLFNERLTLKVDLFRELRSDILTTLNNIPAYVSVGLPAVNVGRVENKGYEARFDWNDQIGNFSYGVGANISFARNKIIDMDEIPRNESYQRRTGKRVGQRFGYVFDSYYTQEQVDQIGTEVADPGFNARPGDLKYKDLNNDGVIDGADQKAIGNPRIPEYVFGGRFSLGYKNIRLSTDWAAATSTSRMLGYVPGRTGFGPNGGRTILQWQVDGHWTPEKGQNANYPRMSLLGRSRRNSMDSNYWLRDGSYLRLKNAELSYEFTPEMLEPIGLRNLRVYISGYNLLTFSKLDIMDPESTGDSRYQQYPIMKVYNFGINIGF